MKIFVFKSGKNTLFFCYPSSLYSLLDLRGHYWTKQYGTRSILMSGSVIGGAEDLGTVFYNPGRLTISCCYNDEWMSLTWSYPLTEKLSIGLTNAYTKSSSQKNIDMQLQLLYEDNIKVAQLARNRMVDFNHNGLLWKIGFAWESKFADLGLTVTTPKVHLRGTGSFLYEDFLAGLPESLEASHFESSIQG